MSKVEYKINSYRTGKIKNLPIVSHFRITEKGELQIEKPNFGNVNSNDISYSYTVKINNGYTFDYSPLFSNISSYLINGKNTIDIKTKITLKSDNEIFNIDFEFDDRYFLDVKITTNNIINLVSKNSMYTPLSLTIFVDSSNYLIKKYIKDIDVRVGKILQFFTKRQCYKLSSNIKNKVTLVKKILYLLLTEINTNINYSGGMEFEFLESYSFKTKSVEHKIKEISLLNIDFVKCENIFCIDDSSISFSSKANLELGEVTKNRLYLIDDKQLYSLDSIILNEI